MSTTWFSKLFSYHLSFSKFFTSIIAEKHIVTPYLMSIEIHVFHGSHKLIVYHNTSVYHTQNCRKIVCHTSKNVYHNSCIYHTNIYRYTFVYYTLQQMYLSHSPVIRTFSLHSLIQFNICFPHNMSMIYITAMKAIWNSLGMKYNTYLFFP